MTIVKLFVYKNVKSKVINVEFLSRGLPLNLIWETQHFIGGLDNPLETMLYYLISGYLYFPNNLKDIKDHVQAYMISFKIFFQLMVTVFKENLNLQLPLIFYCSIRVVFETEFISEPTAENRFRFLLEISGKFITTKVRDETFRNGKSYEDKAQCLLPLPPSMGRLFS